MSNLSRRGLLIILLQKRTVLSNGKHLPCLIDVFSIRCDVERAGSNELPIGVPQRFLVLSWLKINQIRTCTDSVSRGDHFPICSFFRRGDLLTDAKNALVVQTQLHWYRDTDFHEH